MNIHILDISGKAYDLTFPETHVPVSSIKKQLLEKYNIQCDENTEFCNRDMILHDKETLKSESFSCEPTLLMIDPTFRQVYLKQKSFPTVPSGYNFGLRYFNNFIPCQLEHCLPEGIGINNYFLPFFQMAGRSLNLTPEADEERSNNDLNDEGSLNERRPNFFFLPRNRENPGRLQIILENRLANMQRLRQSEQFEMPELNNSSSPLDLSLFSIDEAIELFRPFDETIEPLPPFDEFAPFRPFDELAPFEDEDMLLHDDLNHRPHFPPRENPDPQPQAPQGNVHVPELNIDLSPEDQQAIQRICRIGFDRLTAIQVYVACDRNEDNAINCLISLD